MVEMESSNYVINHNTLKSVWYRAPIYLRDIYKPNISASEQLYRSQWSAFVRNLSFFESPLWVNRPEATFQAEKTKCTNFYLQVI